MTHTYKFHHFHLIWSTKNRQNLIDNKFKSRLYDYMGGIIKEYIQNQEEHHRVQTYEEEYIHFLNLHGMKFDPRFVFG